MFTAAIIGSGALSALIIGLIHLREQKQKKDDGIKAGGADSSLAFGVTESDTAQITAIIIDGADVLGYLLAEGLTDAAAGKPAVQEGTGDEVK